MPVYVYQCKNCNHVFEQRQSFSDDALRICPQCGARCTACLGTDSVLTPEQIRSLPPELFLAPQEEEEKR